VILGRVGSILGQKSALTKLLKTVLYASCVFNAYFTILNVSEVRMSLVDFISDLAKARQVLRLDRCHTERR